MAEENKHGLTCIPLYDMSASNSSENSRLDTVLDQILLRLTSIDNSLLKLNERVTKVEDSSKENAREIESLKTSLQFDSDLLVEQGKEIVLLKNELKAQSKEIGLLRTKLDEVKNLRFNFSDREE